MSVNSGGKTRLSKNVPEKLKHLSAHAAVDRQSSIPLSDGSASGGQQSCIDSEIDTSANFWFTAAMAAIGSVATENITRNASMVRVMLMIGPGTLLVSGDPIRGSNDVLASGQSPSWKSVLMGINFTSPYRSRGLAVAHQPYLSRRSALFLAAGVFAFPVNQIWAAEHQVVTVHKDLNCR